MYHRHFGQEILSTILNEPSSSPTVQTLFLKMYSDFVEAFDGIDNGIAQYVSSEPARYRSRTDISSRVAALNPRWNEPSNEQILLERFEVASKLCDIEFRERLDYLAKAWLPAREIVQRAVEKRKEEAHPSGKVVIFSEFAPWKVSFPPLRSARRVAPGATLTPLVVRRSTSTSSSRTSRSRRTSSRSTSSTRKARRLIPSGASRLSPSRPSPLRAGRRFPRRESLNLESIAPARSAWSGAK